MFLGIPILNAYVIVINSKYKIKVLLILDGIWVVLFAPILPMLGRNIFDYIGITIFTLIAELVIFTFSFMLIDTNS